MTPPVGNVAADGQGQLLGVEAPDGHRRPELGARRGFPQGSGRPAGAARSGCGGPVLPVPRGLGLAAVERLGSAVQTR